MDTCVCPSVHVWTETKKHTSYDHLCPSAHVWTVRSYKTPLLWLFFWYSWYFCGYFVYLQPHETDSHTGKKTPKFMDKSSHKTPFCGSGHTDAATQNPIATQEKAPKFMDKSSHKTPFCGSVRPSVCLSHLFHHVPIIVSSWNFQELLPWSEVMSMQKVKVRGQRSRSQRSTPNLAVSGL